jgi:urease accessory protein
MRSTARIVVAAGPAGRTRFLTAAGTGLLTPRRTGPTRVHLVAAAGGPLGGDDYDLEISVGAGARLEVCSAAASIVLAAGTSGPSRLTIRAEVADGGELVLTPGLVLITRRGRHESHNEFSVAGGGRLLARELLVLGRSGEIGGRGICHTRLDVSGRPAVRQTVHLDPTHEGNRGPAVLAGARAVGQLLFVGEEAVPSGARGARAAWLPLGVPAAAMFSVTAPDPAAASSALEEATTEAMGLSRPVQASRSA